MRFQDAMFVMIDEKICIKREGWHFNVWYEPVIGEFITGYNNEQWYPTAEDYAAEDWIIDSNESRPLQKRKLRCVHRSSE